MANAVGSLETGATRQTMGQRAIDALRQHPVTSFFVLSYVLMYTSSYHVHREPGAALRSVLVHRRVQPDDRGAGPVGDPRRRAEDPPLLAGFTKWRIGWVWYVFALSTVLIPLAPGHRLPRPGERVRRPGRRNHRPVPARRAGLHLPVGSLERGGRLARLRAATAPGAAQRPGGGRRDRRGVDVLARPRLLPAGCDDDPAADVPAI